MIRSHPEPTVDLTYVKQTGDGRHGLFAFDLWTRASHQVFPETSPALTFEWAPDGEHLVCVLGSPHRDPAHDGIWIGPISLSMSPLAKNLTSSLPPLTFPPNIVPRPRWTNVFCGSFIQL